MCVTVEIDFTEEMIVHMKTITKSNLASVINDECSMAILDECEPEVFDELALAVGTAILNSVVVDLIKLGIEMEEEDRNETE